MRAVALLLVGLLLAPAVAGASATMLPTTLDDRIGDVSERLEVANATYGERSEFRSARVELSRAGLALLSNATLVTEDNVIKAVGALETGRARAMARTSTDPSQRIVDHAQELATTAENLVAKLRFDLRSMERTGLEPVAFDAGLAVAHGTLRAIDLLQQYQLFRQQAGQGEMTPEIEAGLVSSAAGALALARVSSDLLVKVAQARAVAHPEPFLPYAELESLTHQRVEWASARASPSAQQSKTRLLAMDQQGDDLLTLAAYLLWFQDVSFNGLLTELQRGQPSVDPTAEAWRLVNETAPKADTWLDQLGADGDLPRGALESAVFTLRLSASSTGRIKNESGAFAVAFAHLGAEHVGLLQEAYGGIAHEPGTALYNTDGTQAVPKRNEGPGLLLYAIAAGLLVVVGLAVWRARR